MKLDGHIILVSLLFTLIQVLGMSEVTAQKPKEQDWNIAHGGGKNGIPLELYNQPDNGYLLVSYQYENPDSSWHLWFTKFKSDGMFSWERDLGLFDNDYFNQFFYIPKLGFWLSGSSFFKINNTKEKGPIRKRRMEMYFAQMDQDGKRLWKKGYATDTMIYHNKCTIRTQDMGFLTCLSTIDEDISKKAGDYSQMSFIKLNREGKIQWRKKYNDIDRAPHIVLEKKDGNMLVLGSQQTKGSTITGFWLSLFSNKGDLLWTKIIDRKAQERFNKIVVTKDGNVFIIGNSGWQKGQSKHILLLKTDPEGNELWRKSYTSDQGGSMEDFDLLVHSNNTLQLLSKETIAGKSSNTLLYELDQDGSLISKTSIPLAYQQSPKKLLESNDGSILLYGHQIKNKVDEVWITKLK